MSVEKLRTPQTESEYRRGFGAAQGDVALEDLCTWPSREYLLGYCCERYGVRLGTIMAIVVPRVKVGQLDKTAAALGALPEQVLHVLATALIDARGISDDDEPL